MEMILKLIGMLTGKGSPGQQSSILGPLTEMLGGGGLGDILGGFQKAGLGGKLESMTGSGQNAKLRPKEVTQILGQDKLNEIARKANVSPRVAKGGIASMLPGVIDQVTPNGQALEGDALSEALGSLLNR